MRKIVIHSFILGGINNENLDTSYSCCTPNGNDSCNKVYADMNGNGTYEADIDQVAIEGLYWDATFTGCAGYHDVTGLPVPSVNGFARVYGVEPEMIAPVFYWIGDATGSVVGDGEELAEFHVADLTVPNAVIMHENPNHS